MFDWSALEMLSAPEAPMWLPVVCKMLEQNNTPEISSDLSEVFVLSALEMLSTPASPILLYVTFKCCTKKFFFENEQSIFWNLSGCM